MSGGLFAAIKIDPSDAEKRRRKLEERIAATGHRKPTAAMQLAADYVRRNPGCTMRDCAQAIYPSRSVKRGWKRDRLEFRPIYRAIRDGLIVKGPSPINSACGLYEDEDRAQLERARLAELAERYPGDMKAQRKALKLAQAIGDFLVEAGNFAAVRCPACGWAMEKYPPQLRNPACWKCPNCGQTTGCL